MAYKTDGFVSGKKNGGIFHDIVQSIPLVVGRTSMTGFVAG
jgi:hypothetical protein